LSRTSIVFLTLVRISSKSWYVFSKILNLHSMASNVETGEGVILVRLKARRFDSRLAVHHGEGVSVVDAIVISASGGGTGWGRWDG
jgi:hypothetical protein